MHNKEREGSAKFLRFCFYTPFALVKTHFHIFNFIDQINE